MQAVPYDNLVPAVKWAAIWTPAIKFWTTKEDLSSDRLAADPYSRVYISRSGSRLPDDRQKLQQGHTRNTCVLAVLRIRIRKKEPENRLQPCCILN